MHQLRATGWGAPRIQNYDEKRESLTILVDNNPLVATLGEGVKSDRPICHNFRGYWAGVFSELLERRVSCAEAKCIGMGDVNCEFKITSA